MKRLIEERSTGFKIETDDAASDIDAGLYIDHGPIPDGLATGRLTVIGGAIVTDDALLWSEIRQQRDFLLFATDGTQAQDRPDDYRLPWVTYRQALRDMTLAADPASVEWPTPPDADELDRLSRALGGLGIMQ